MKKWMIIACLLPLVFAGCGGGGGSSEVSGGTNLQVSLTDSPGDYLSVLITITGIYAIVGDSGPYRLEFADFSSPAIIEATEGSVTVDLLQLANQEPISFALGDLPQGDLSQLRLIISEASLTAYEDDVEIDGDGNGEIEHVEATYPVKVPSGPQTGVKLNPRDIDIHSGSLTSLTLDFDAGKSIVQLGGSGKSKRDYDFILKPVIFILDAVGTIPVDTETIATGLNFPTDLKAVEGAGEGSILSEGDILVANAGTSGTNSENVIAVDVSQTLPVDASAITPFVSHEDTFASEPLVNSPSGLSQHLDLVWLSNALSATVVNAGTAAEIYTSGDVSAMYVDNAPPTESVAGLVETSGMEFGGFAPNGSLTGDDFIMFQANGNGSITGILIKEKLIFDVLPAGSFSGPSDLAFVPSATPAALGDPIGTPVGTLYVTDASTNEVGVVSLTTTGGAVGDGGTRVSGELAQTLSYPFLSEPIGIAYSSGSDQLYIASRGNGTITAITPDGAEVATYDTGLGANALNGIDVVPGVEDVLYVTNTAGNDDPSNDDPAVLGASTLERVSVTLP